MTHVFPNTDRGYFCEATWKDLWVTCGYMIKYSFYRSFDSAIIF